MRAATWRLWFKMSTSFLHTTSHQTLSPFAKLLSTLFHYTRTFLTWRFVVVFFCRHCPRGVVMEIRRAVTPPTADRGTPLLYAVTDDVIYTSSDDDDDDDSSLNLSSLNDDVDYDWMSSSRIVHIATTRFCRFDTICCVYMHLLICLTVKLMERSI